MCLRNETTSPADITSSRNARKDRSDRNCPFFPSFLESCGTFGVPSRGGFCFAPEKGLLQPLSATKIRKIKNRPLGEPAL